MATELHCDWGDGRVEHLTSLHARHTYRKPGKYTVRLYVRGSDGQVAVRAETVTLFRHRRRRIRDRLLGR